jgi:hypothetical protein
MDRISDGKLLLLINYWSQWGKVGREDLEKDTVQALTELRERRAKDKADAVAKGYRQNKFSFWR